MNQTKEKENFIEISQKFKSYKIVKINIIICLQKIILQF